MSTTEEDLENIEKVLVRMNDFWNEMEQTKKGVYQMLQVIQIALGTYEDSTRKTKILFSIDDLRCKLEVK